MYAVSSKPTTKIKELNENTIKLLDKLVDEQAVAVEKIRETEMSEIEDYLTYQCLVAMTGDKFLVKGSVLNEYCGYQPNDNNKPYDDDDIIMIFPLSNFGVLFERENEEKTTLSLFGNLIDDKRRI